MASTVDQRLDGIPRKSLAMRGEGLRKKFAEPLCLGRVVERTIQIAGYTNDQAGRHMGYQDGSSVARWISGAEPVQLGRLVSHPVLLRSFVAALAERCGAEVDVRMVVSVDLRKAVGS